MNGGGEIGVTGKGRDKAGSDTRASMRGQRGERGWRAAKVNARGDVCAGEGNNFACMEQARQFSLHCTATKTAGMRGSRNTSEAGGAMFAHKGKALLKDAIVSAGQGMHVNRMFDHQALHNSLAN